MPDERGRMCQLIDRASLVTLAASLCEAGIDSSLLWHGTDRWDLPEPVLGAWIGQAGGAIAHAINAAMAVIDFPMVKIDGWLPKDVRDRLVDQVRADLERLDFTGLDRPRIVAGTIGRDARAVGAASHPLLGKFLTGYTR